VAVSMLMMLRRDMSFIGCWTVTLTPAAFLKWWWSPRTPAATHPLAVRVLMIVRLLIMLSSPLLIHTEYSGAGKRSTVKYTLNTFYRMRPINRTHPSGTIKHMIYQPSGGAVR
jgi:hypothetical protein